MVMEGFAMSVQARKAIWKATRAIKQKLFKNSLLPESTLTVCPLCCFDPIVPSTLIAQS
jgi:hypothetical protein